MDVYGEQGDEYMLAGHIETKLTVLTDPKQIRDHLRATSHQTSTQASTGPQTNRKDGGGHTAKKALDGTASLSSSAPLSPMNIDPYAVDINDSKHDIGAKFLLLLALGPTTKHTVVERMKVSATELQPFFAAHAQVYDPNDTFISDDNFPCGDTESDAGDQYILKDKSYKDTRPWTWKWYSVRERTMIINNIHNALTRLGYLETHPLRKKICEEPAETSATVPKPADNKKSALGGGILVSKTKKSPTKRSQTESPKLPSETANFKQIERPRQNGSPLKASVKRRAPSSSSASDEERSFKKKKNDSDSHTSPSSSINDDDPTISINDTIDTMGKNRGISHETDDINHKLKRFQYYSTLADKFKAKYKEYESLYTSLKSNPKNSSNDKKQLVRLFELHNSLSEWKRQLWDFDSENKLKLNIMNLSKHKKQPSKSASSTPIIPQTAAPFASDSIILRRNNTHSRNNNVPKLALDY